MRDLHVSHTLVVLSNRDCPFKQNLRSESVPLGCLRDLRRSESVPAKLNT
jgi:hypothetical protein